MISKVMFAPAGLFFSGTAIILTTIPSNCDILLKLVDAGVRVPRGSNFWSLLAKRNKKRNLLLLLLRAPSNSSSVGNGRSQTQVVDEGRKGCGLLAIKKCLPRQEPCCCSGEEGEKPAL